MNRKSLAVLVAVIAIFSCVVGSVYAGTIGVHELYGYDFAHGFTWVNSTNFGVADYWRGGANYTAWIEAQIAAVPGGGATFDQDLNTTDSVTFDNVTATKWANATNINADDYWRGGENYTLWIETEIAGAGNPFNQSLDTTDSVTFDDAIITDELTVGGVSITSWSDLNISEPTGGTGFSLGAYTYLLMVNSSYVGDPGVNQYLVYNQTSDLVFTDTNYTAAILYAADAASALGGGYIYHSEGYYYNDMPTRFLDVSNVIFGGSHGAIIVVGSTQLEALGSFGWQFNTIAGGHPCYNITIRDLMWDCDAVNDLIDGSVILIRKTNDNFLIENLNMYGGHTWTHIYGYECPGTVTVTNCVFTECEADAGVVHPHSGHDWTITNNVFQGGDGEAIRHGRLVANNRIIDFTGSGAYSNARIVGGDDPYLCIGNVITGGGGDGIYAWDTNSQYLDNYISGLSGTGRGIYTRGGFCDYDVIDGNYIYRAIGVGIYIVNGDDFVTVSHNYFFECYSENVEMEGDDGEIIGNTFYRPDHLGAGVDDVIFLDSSARTLVSHNKMTNNHATAYARYGVYVYQSHNCTVSYNHMQDVVNGIRVDGSTGTLLTGNTILPKDCTNSIYLVNGANYTASFNNYNHKTAVVSGAACTNNSFTNNIFPGDITDTGTGTRAWENLNPWSGVFITTINGP